MSTSTNSSSNSRPRSETFTESPPQSLESTPHRSASKSVSFSKSSTSSSAALGLPPPPLTPIERAAYNQSEFTTLDLDNTGLGLPEHADDLAALCKGLITNIHITSLRLTRNSLDHMGAKALCHALSGGMPLKTLTLGWNNIGPGEHEVDAESIKPSGCRALAYCFEKHETLTHLCVRDNNCADGVVELAEALQSPMSVLEALDLRGNSLDDVGAKAIGMMLGKNRTLTTLYLGENDFGPAGAINIAKGLARKLEIPPPPVRTEDLKVVDGKVVHLEPTFSLSTIRTLDLGGNQIGDDGVRALAKSMDLVKTLNLSWCGIGSAGAKFLAAGLKRKSNGMTNLQVQGNELGDVGARALAKALRNSSSRKATIERIDLGSNGVGDKGATGLAEALAPNPTRGASPLTTLLLDWNEIGDAGATSLAESLGSLGVAPGMRLRMHDSKVTTVGRKILAQLKLSGVDLQVSNYSDAEQRHYPGGFPTAAPSLLQCELCNR